MFAAFNSAVNKTPLDPDEMSDVIFQLVYNAASIETSVPKKKIKIPKGERTEMRRNQIIKNARRIFSNKGYAKATISEVASEAGLADATLYEYFENKEAILLAIAENNFNSLSEDEDIRLTGSSVPEKTLRKMIWTWIQHIYTNQEFTRILTLDLSRNKNFYTSPSFKYIKMYWDKAGEVIQQGQKEGVFRDDFPITTFYQMVRGTLDQYLLSQFLLGAPPLGIQELNNAVDTFIRAILINENNSSDIHR